MNTAVLDQLVQCQPGRLAADVVESTDNDHAGRVIDDDIDAGGLLEGADVAALAADDAAFHVVAGDVHGADRSVGSVLGGVALNGGGHNLTGLLFTNAFQVFFVFLNAARHLVGQFLAETLQQHNLGLLPIERADLVQFLHFVGQELLQLLVLLLDLGPAFLHFTLGVIDKALLS